MPGYSLELMGSLESTAVTVYGLLQGKDKDENQARGDVRRVESGEAPDAELPLSSPREVRCPHFLAAISSHMP